MLKTAALILLGSACLSQTSTKTMTDAVYVAVDARRFAAESTSSSASGAKLGYAVRRTASRFTGLIEAGYLAADSARVRFLSLGIGARRAVFASPSIELGVAGIVEYQHARVEEYQNANHLLAVAAGAYGDIRLSSRLSLTLTLSAQAFGDATPPTTCNDGSTSQSTGQGTCSHHGGIDFYNDKFGNGVAVDALLGLSVWFGGAINQHR